jgi:hypothetical protein
MQEIKITIEPDGNVKTEVHGVKGAGCKALTNAIEGALGAIKSNKATPEMFEKEQKAKIKLGGA